MNAKSRPKPALHRIPVVGNELGSIGILEDRRLLPFEIERVYYLFGVPVGAERGSHGHKTLEQFMVAISGSVTVELDSGSEKHSFVLDSPDIGLYVPPGMWRDLRNFAETTCCLVLASSKFSEEDYMRDYQEFLDWSNGR